jgi:tetratricopeptide (TPR) repeat protein
MAGQTCPRENAGRLSCDPDRLRSPEKQHQLRNINSPVPIVSAFRTALFRIPAVLLAVLLALCSLATRAAYLDNVEVDTSGKNVLIRIHFNTRFQYLRHVPEKQGEVLQIFLRQQAGNVPPPAVEETKSLAATDLTPKIFVTYPLQTGVPTKQLLVKFDRTVQFQVRQGVDPFSIEIVLQPVVVAKPRKPTVPPKYAISLDTYASAAEAKGAPLPPELSRYETILSKSDISDVELYDRNVGYFDTAEAADVIRDRILPKFPNARVVDLSAGTTLVGAGPPPAAVPVPRAKQQPPVATAPPLPTPKTPTVQSTPAPAIGAPATAVVPAPALGAPAAAVPAPVPGAPAATAVPSPAVPKPAEPAAVAEKGAQPVATTAAPDVERQAREAMEKVRSAFADNKWDDAINALNQLLILPPNSLSQQAQEMVGLARERSGQLAKAKAEYELYLKLYPDAEGAKRVKERLAMLEQRLAGAPAGARPASEPVEARAPVKTLFGSIAQYYYEGKTKSESAFNTPTTVDQASLTSRDLAAIVTTVDANARYRSEQSDVRLVFRDTDSVSLIDRNPSRNRLDAAYVDYRGLQNPYSLRLGRQIGTGGGIFGRFDGAIAGYKFTKNLRINANVGAPVDYGLDSKRYFYGLNLDAENVFDNWSGNVYVIRQMVDGIHDRDAVGGEVRYFKNSNSLYSMVDYDTLFKQWNMVMIQGSVQTSGRTNFTILLDQRKAPPLSTTNAVFGQPVTSVEALLRTNTEEQLRQKALAITSDVKQVLASVTTPVSAAWQICADYRLTNVGPLPAYNDIPATPGTGDIHAYSLQAIGSNVYSSRDINVFSGTWLQSPLFRGESLSYSNLTGIGPKWTLEPSLRWYTQRDDTDTKANRYTAVLRLTYALKANISLDGEYDVERSVTVTPVQQETAVHQFFYVGYRYSF